LRTVITKDILSFFDFKNQLLHWANQHREVVFLDSNQYHQKYSSYDAVLAVDAFTSIKTDFENAFQDLYQYQSQTKDWLFGYLSYDLKNDTEDLHSNNFDGLDFPVLFFFQPKKLFLIKGPTGRVGGGGRSTAAGATGAACAAGSCLRQKNSERMGGSGESGPAGRVLESQLQATARQEKRSRTGNGYHWLDER
jgi:anthranilate/para-aminobenzoate synthase component I